MNSPDPIGTLANLIRIPSINPAYPHGSGEAEIQAWILGFFRDHGIPADEQTAMPGRSNVIARLRGKNAARRIVFEAHCDTAGIQAMSIAPFDPQIRDGRLYGRGACDTKAGLAAMMCALADLKGTNAEPQCDVWVASTVDEEHSYRGVLKLCEGLQASAAVVSEPTGMKMAIASKGCLRWRITVNGKAAHSSKPGLGANAIEHMARIVRVLEEHRTSLGRFRHPLVGSPTLNVGLIQGGTQVNVVPPSCWIEVDRRLIPGEEPGRVLDEYRQLLASIRAPQLEMEAVMEQPALQDDPLETPASSPIVSCASGVLAQLGLDARPHGVPFGSDASKFSNSGIPSIILGPGCIEQAHTADEFVEIEQVEKAFEVYRRLMLSFE